MEPVRFVRVVRTSTSEVYVLWEDEERLGQMDLHYAHDVIHANIVLERETSVEDRKELVSQVDQEVVSSYLPSFDREDFLVTLFHGHEVDSYSDGGGELGEDIDLEDDDDF